MSIHFEVSRQLAFCNELTLSPSSMNWYRKAGQRSYGKLVNVKWGWQYYNFIYDKVVVKRRMPLTASLVMRFLAVPGMRLRPSRLVTKSRAFHSKTSLDFNLLKDRSDLHEFFAVLEFREDRVIQERLCPLGENLSEKTIDELFRFILKMWEHQFFETSYNFTANYGLNGDGQVKLIDIGELCFDKKRLLRDIRRECWLNHYNFRRLPDGSTKKYLRDAAARILSFERVEEYWGKAG